MEDSPPPTHPQKNKHAVENLVFLNHLYILHSTKYLITAPIRKNLWVHRPTLKYQAWYEKGRLLLNKLFLCDTCIYAGSLLFCQM